MSLVELDNDAPSLNLRVFKRSGRHLVLLWNRLQGIDNKPIRISAKSLDSGARTQVVDYVLNPANRAEVGESLQVDPSIVICVINEAKNNLDEKQNYYFTVEYDGTDIRQSIRVTKAGVFPDHEKEDRDRNVHSFLWDPKGQNWRKWSGVMVNGRFYAGVVSIPCANCGHDPSRQE